MKQSAAERPDPTHQRKAAIARGEARDHGGSVCVAPIPRFDLNRTIFQTLEGKAARYVMKKRVGKTVRWLPDAAKIVEADYDAALAKVTLPPVSAELTRFLVEECDFDVEHADGSFLDHLYFCFEYTTHHYPKGSPLVMLLHSILGTGTNTFAMSAEKIPALKALIDPADWRHIEAFPSVLRLLYAGDLRRTLRDNLHRLDKLQSIELHRVIDNAKIVLSGEDLWVALNYQLIHLVDFLPVANWGVHHNDTSFILFRDLYDLLDRAGKRDAVIGYQPNGGVRELVGEKHGLGDWLLSRVPVSTTEKMAAQSVRRFSERIGHSLDYKLVWG